jgi:hypothetical protein
VAGLDPAIQQNKEIFRRADARRLDGRLLALRPRFARTGVAAMTN